MGKKTKISLSMLLVLIIVCVGYTVWAMEKSFPEVTARLQPLANALTPPSYENLAWPKGEAAAGIESSSNIIDNGDQTPLATASTAKLITALTVLKVKPLGLNQTGPIITISPADVAIYNKYVTEDGSVVKVVTGEQISEYQLLEGMLLPSANNMADTLANWAFGSQTAYSEAANSFLKDNNLSQTTVGVDASGFDPSTTSTAHDLVKIGEMAMENPVLAQIVDMKSVTNFPVVGTITNVNSLLGKDGIIGVKTGNNNQDMGVFISASNVEINNKTVTLLTSLMDSPSLQSALNTSLPFISSLQKDFQDVNLIKIDEVIAKYQLPWNNQVIEATAQDSLSAYTWNNMIINKSIHLQPITKPLAKNETVGKITVNANSLNNSQSVNVVLSSTIPKPPIIWRLKHAL